MVQFPHGRDDPTPRLRRGGLTVALYLAIAGYLAACDGNATRSYKVGDRTFSIPAEFVETGTVPWLPLSQHDSPLLVLNPNARLQDHIFALLEPVSTACRGIGENSEGTWVHACHFGATSEPALPPLKLKQLRKVPDEFNVTWQYFSESTLGAPRLVATCSKPPPDSPWGRCTHLYRNNDILVTLRLDEDQLIALPAIRRSLDEALERWETSRS